MSKLRYGLTDKEARAFVGMLTTSPQKLNLVAAGIRKMPVQSALNFLTFSKKRSANDVKKALLSAIANASTNHGLDADKLFVKECYVGKAMVLKRFRPGYKGRAYKILRPFSNLTVIVQEVQPEEKKVEKKVEKKTVVKKETKVKKEK
jgi:large subunit ribosomal protein L22